MRAWNVIPPLAVAALLIAGSAVAGGVDRLGTAGAQELRIPVGAASIALGGSVVAMSNGIANIYYNPASLSASDRSEAIAAYSTYLADCQVSYGALSTRLGSAGNIAGSIKVLSIGDIIVTTEDAPDGTGEVLSPQFAVFGLTYSRRMTDRVLIGLTGSFVQEQVAEAKAQGFAADLGVLYDTGWRGLRFGFAMKNIGPTMRFDGPGFEQKVVLPGDNPAAAPHVVTLQPAEFELPAYLQVGMGYDIVAKERSVASLYATFQSNNFSTDEYRLGAEYRVGEWFALRGGLTGQIVLDSEDKQPEYMYGYSYGAGFKFNLGTTPVHLDWAGTSTGDYFDDNQQFSLQFEF